jgi:hypothetical protein
MKLSVVSFERESTIFRACAIVGKFSFDL